MRTITLLLSIIVPMVINTYFPDYQSVFNEYNNEYYLEDIDNDGEDECLILDGINYWHGSFDIYDIVDGRAKKVGELGAGSTLYYDDDKNYYGVMTHTGYTVVNRLEPMDGMIYRRTVFEEDTGQDGVWSYDKAIEKFGLHECIIYTSNRS